MRRSAPLELWHGDKGHSGHFVLDLERLPGGVRTCQCCGKL
jgi:hypothetical protein